MSGANVDCSPAPCSPLEILVGDCRDVLKDLDDETVDCCVTSPPYFGLRDYLHPDQVGLETHPKVYVGVMVEIFREVRRILKPHGTLWLNLGDTYRDKRLLGIPWQVALALSRDTAVCVFCGEWEDLEEWGDTYEAGLKTCPWCKEDSEPDIEEGWILRQEIIWQKPNAMPEAVKDRCSRSHEQLFMFSKSGAYQYAPILEPVQSDRSPSRKAKAGGVGKAGSGRTGTAYDGTSTTRNRRTVWNVPVSQCRAAHFAPFPEDLVKPCILAATEPGGTVLDPFGGTGTTGKVALELGRNAVLIELNPEYAEIIKRRTHVTPGLHLLENACREASPQETPEPN